MENENNPQQNSLNQGIAGMIELAKLDYQIFNQFFPEGSELRAAWEKDKTGASDYRVKALLEEMQQELEAFVEPKREKLVDFLVSRTLGRT